VEEVLRSGEVEGGVDAESGRRSGGGERSGEWFQK
jgi:hypothetical protein